MSFTVNAYGAKQAEVSSVIEKVQIKRRAVGPNDVHIEIKAATICHSDMHYVRSEWGPVAGVQVPGHEIVGEIKAVGANVDPARVGQYVGVGCMVGANCTGADGKRVCSSCVQLHDERFCTKGHIGTYGSVEVVDGVQQSTFGGYSTDIVVDAHFAVPLPDYFKDPENIKFSPAIMCAGTTLYTALKYGGCAAGKKVGINGIGGLGMYGIQIALALGAEVYAFTRSQEKVAFLKELGCKDVILTTDAAECAKHANTLDLIIDTVSALHSTEQLLNFLVPFGKLGVVGAPPSMSFAPFAIVMKQLSVYGSLIGSIKDSQEVLELCAKHKICVPVELIHPSKIEEAYGRMLKSDVKYRFAIDVEAMRRGE